MPRRSPVRILRGLLATTFCAYLVACGGGPSGPGAPAISKTAPPNGATGVPYFYAFAVQSGGTFPFVWSEQGNLPPGMGFSSTGQLTGSPTQPGTFPLSVTVTDSAAPPASGSFSFSLIIVDSPINIASSPTPPDGTTTYPYPGYTFSVASGGTPPFTWSLTQGPLPPGLTLTNGAISGTPTAQGPFPITVTATDSANPAESASIQFTLTVNNPPPPVVNATPAPPVGTNGNGYGYQFTATGGFLPLSWAVTSGSLPPGLSLSSTGAVSGTATAAGTFTFTVTVTDSAPTAQTNSLQFSIVVNNPPPPTIINIPPPTASVGVGYSNFQFNAANGLAPINWGETGMMPGLTLSLAGVLSGTPTAAGIYPITVTATDALGRASPPAPFTVRVSLNRPAAAFTATGSMTIPRVGHTATLLTSGKVLIAGGPDASAEVYDPATAMFTSTGSMILQRANHTATLLAASALPNYGKVLVLGGGNASDAAELYDPTAGTFASTGTMTTPRANPTATLLQNGHVLVVGGNTVSGDLSAEIYDPGTGAFTKTGSSTVARTGHTATLLADGRVLIAGGGTATAELYDPGTGMFTATGSMAESRTGNTATRLQDGTVLIAGTGSLATTFDAAELYSPGSGTFASVGSIPAGASGISASLRNDGTVLVAGFSVSAPYRHRLAFARCTTSVARVTLGTAELFAAESQGFTATGSLATSRFDQSATVLTDGSILVAGGQKQAVTGNYLLCNQGLLVTTLASAEIYK